MELLRPDAGKLIYLALGFFVAPKLLKLIRN